MYINLFFISGLIFVVDSADTARLIEAVKKN